MVQFPATSISGSSVVSGSRVNFDDCLIELWKPHACQLSPMWKQAPYAQLGPPNFALHHHHLKIFQEPYFHECECNGFMLTFNYFNSHIKYRTRWTYSKIKAYKSYRTRKYYGASQSLPKSNWIEHTMVNLRLRARTPNPQSLPAHPFVPEFQSSFFGSLHVHCLREQIRLHSKQGLMQNFVTGGGGLDVW